MNPIQNLQLRIILPFSLLLVLAAALVWWAATGLMNRALEQRLGEQIAHAGNRLAEGAFPLTPQLIRRIGSLLNADITLLRADGSIGISTLAAASPTLQRLTTNWNSALADVEDDNDYLRSGRYLLAARRLPSGRDARYRVVLLSTSLDDARSATGEAALWLGVVTLLGALLLAWMAHRIVGDITQPIRRLAAMADRIASGDRQVRVEIDQRNELGLLARSLNGMTRRLQGYEDELAEQSRITAQGRVAARVAHEIRNPLTAIKLQLQLLGESLDDGPRSSVRELLDEVERLELIVSTTLQQNRSPLLQRRPVALNELVNEVCKLFSPQLSHRRIELHRSLQPQLPDARLDADRIKQVLVNLLINAADALPEGGRIEIASTFDPATRLLALSVSDSGLGIPAIRRAALFEHGSSDKPFGNGIGLPLCRELIEAHGGRIEVDEDPLGGARFTLYLPVGATA